MSKEDKGKKVRSRKQRLTYILLGSGTAVVGAGVLCFIAYTVYYNDKVLPHVRVAGQLASGKTLSQASDSLQTKIDSITATPLTVQVGDQKLEVHAIDINLIADSKGTAQDAYAVGRTNNFWSSLADSTKQLVMPQNVPIAVTYDKDKLNDVVKTFADKVDQPESNAGIKVENGTVVQKDAVTGHRIDQEAVKNAVIGHWTSGNTSTITVAKHDVAPSFTKADTAAAMAQANSLRSVKIDLSTSDKDIKVDQATLDSWISSEVSNSKLRLSLDTDQVKQWLNKISSNINIDPAEARIAMQDGKISITTPGQQGKSLDVDKTADAINSAVRSYVDTANTAKTLSVAAVLTASNPAVTDQTISQLGINELIATATTSFTGSPENRKHNIAVGAAALSGILIKPGEEFSTLRYLGKIDGAGGYLPELVIKENQTVPEFGGGLCQVSTTLFRVAMQAGLKITQRRNHSYRVPYYEPPVGMDATIYEGGPDFAFVNTTDHYILVQSHIDGVKITFDMYGTKDGRTISQTDPIVSNVTPPPDPQYIQTDTLPTGTTKQTEKAHNGSDAVFTYSVMDASGKVINKQTFTSHYVPWQARFLVGTGPAPTQ